MDEHFREAAEGVGGLRVLLVGPGCCWLVEAPEAVKTKTRGSGGLIRFTVMGVAWVTAVFQWYRIFLRPGIGCDQHFGLGVDQSLGLGVDQEP